MTHRPTDESRERVKMMSAVGVRQEDLANVMGISPTTLAKHYRSELDTGYVVANAKVAETLFRKATGNGPQSVTAAIFWLKCRAGWKDTTVIEHAGGLTLDADALSGLSDEELRLVQKMAAKVSASVGNASKRAAVDEALN